MKYINAAVSALTTVSIILGFGVLLGGCNGGDNTQGFGSFKGAWINPNQGMALHIGDNSVTGYSYSRATCAVRGNLNQLPFLEAEKILTQLKPSANNRQLTYLPRGDIEANRKSFVAATLPAPCTTAPQPNTFNPQHLFEHSWHMLNDYYPQFSQRNILWQSLWDTYRPRISEDTTEDALLKILSVMLSVLDDPQVSLRVNTNTIETEFYSGSPAGWYSNYIELASQYDTTQAERLNQLVAVVTQNIQRNYMNAPDVLATSKPGEMPLSWGKLQGNIGYINIQSMTAAAGGNKTDSSAAASLEAQVALIKRQMNTVLEQLKDTDGLIMDLRFSSQGRTEVSLAIANYFTDIEREAYTNKNFRAGSLGSPKSFFLKPVSSTFRYSGPVHLITGPNTAGAAEALTLAMRTLGQVSHLGEASQGSLSETLDIPLMAGWKLGMPHQLVVAAGEKNFAGNGIEPEHVVPVTSIYSAVSFGTQPAIHFALQALGANLDVSASEYKTRVEQIMAAAAIPGLSVAWTNNQAVTDNLAFGFADLEQQRPMTTRTPLNLASISKTFIGVSAAQMAEQGLFNIDTTLGELATTLSIDSPFLNSDDISFAHLATHTAGIAEQSFAYGCSYYFEADLSSVFQFMFPSFSHCPSPAQTKQSAFINQVLSENGSLYSAGHFLDTPLGSRYSYSNVGSAVAAQMLSVAAGMEFEQWTEANIFTPLNMTDSHWFNARYTNNARAPAKRYIFVGDKVTEVPEYALATWVDGGLKSSSRDLSRYLLAMVNGGEFAGVQILNKDSVDTLLNYQLDAITTIGQRLFWVNDGFVFGHRGGDPGTYSQLTYDQYNGLGLIMLMNISDTIGEVVADDSNEFSNAFKHQLHLLNHLTYRRGLTLLKETQKN